MSIQKTSLQYENNLRSAQFSEGQHIQDYNTQKGSKYLPKEPYQIQEGDEDNEKDEDSQSRGSHYTETESASRHESHQTNKDDHYSEMEDLPQRNQQSRSESQSDRDDSSNESHDISTNGDKDYDVDDKSEESHEEEDDQGTDQDDQEERDDLERTRNNANDDSQLVEDSRFLEDSRAEINHQAEIEDKRNFGGAFQRQKTAGAANVFQRTKTNLKGIGSKNRNPAHSKSHDKKPASFFGSKRGRDSSSRQTSKNEDSEELHIDFEFNNVSPDFNKISNNESMPSSSRKSGFAFQAGGGGVRTDDEKRENTARAAEDQIDEEEIEETMEQEDEEEGGRRMPKKRLEFGNNDDYDEEDDRLEQDIKDIPLESEIEQKIKEKQVASYVKLRTEIFKVTSQTSIDKSNRNSRDDEFNLREKKGAPHLIYFGGNKEEKNRMAYSYANYGGSNSKKASNKVRTQRYTALSWAPKSLLLQFKRVSNIYFLIISVLTFMPFSPKNPVSMISTFILVLVFTMIKEAYEDYQRYKSDKEMNNNTTKVFDTDTHEWMMKKWQFIEPGDIIQVECDHEAPADILILNTSNKTGSVFVDTMNLDGETNLKERISMNDGLIDELGKNRLMNIKGEIVCESPNENLEKWEAQITYSKQLFKDKSANIKNLMLRGCFLRNTNEVVGIVVYTGMDTKIMRNLKKPPHKVSNIMKQMNRMLWSVFVFQFALILIFAGLYLNWTTENSKKHFYLMVNQQQEEASTFFIQLLVFWVAYSHMIPISLYVIIEILKLGQASYINRDLLMYDIETQSYAKTRNSDLIEELGQIEMVFSDKTGTITQNKMVFKKCQINGQRFGELKPNEVDTINSMAQSGMKEIREMLKQERIEFSRENSQTQSNSSGFHPYVTHFFLNFVLCNTVMVDYVFNGSKKEPKYKAASPDELALVLGAKNCGIHLLSREHNRMKVYNSATKETLTFKIIAEFPFDSVRKRMSVIVKDLQTNGYKILCKGADSVMMERIIFEKNGIEGLQAIINEDLYQYSTEGLRTLLFAHRTICDEEFKNFKRIYKRLQQSIGPSKEEKLLELYDQMENQLRYIGCSAIEDKLQEGVAVTIAKLMSADIRFFMLTGDKLETAIEIARSCQVIQQHMKVVVINKTKEDILRKMMSIVDKKGDIDLEEHIESLKDVKLFNQVLALEGSTLALILEDETLQNLFFHIAIRSKSVVCCRMSPKQKADVVNVFKKRGKWLTLAIGDGANDVSMIMEAHIGVGIKGKEGTQAVRSADFSISQFQFLLRLLIFQGRNGYMRVSSMICYYFYKNIVLVLTELYFAFFNGFSGQIYFLDWLPMLYNAIFTSWHCLFTLLLEKDVNYHFTYRYPQVYKVGQLRLLFNYTVFWKWIIMAIWHGAVCYYLPIVASEVSSNDSGQRPEHWVPSTISFTMIIHLVILKLLLETRHLSYISISFGIFCLIVYYTFLSFHAATGIIDMIQPQINGVPWEMVKQPRYWLILFGGPLICLLPDFFLNMIKQVFYPNPIDKVIYEQKYIEPNFDHKEIILKLQKSMQSKKRMSAIYSEHRKILLQQRKTSFSVHTVKRLQSSINYRMNSSKQGSNFDFGSSHRFSSSPNHASSFGDRKSTFYSQKNKQKQQSENGESKDDKQYQDPPSIDVEDYYQDEDTNREKYHKKRTQSLKEKSKNKMQNPDSGRPIARVNTKHQQEWKDRRQITAEFRRDWSVNSHGKEGKADENEDGSDQENESQKGESANYIEYFEELGKTVQGAAKVSPPKVTSNHPTPQRQSSFIGANKRTEKERKNRHITFNIQQLDDASKEIESASSFSGNNDEEDEDKAHEKENDEDMYANQIHDKPNNIQEDTIPDVGGGPDDSGRFNPKVSERQQEKTQEKQAKQQQAKAPINIETFKKLCGNRTANYFLISKNYQIPKSRPQTAQDIDDVNPRGRVSKVPPRSTTQKGDFNSTSPHQRTSNLIPLASQNLHESGPSTPPSLSKEEKLRQLFATSTLPPRDDKSKEETEDLILLQEGHHLEKAFYPAFYKAKPDIFRHKKEKKYVQKYRDRSTNSKDEHKAE